MYALGKTSEADAALKKLIDEHGKDASYSIAAVHAFRGDADRAFERLEQAAAAKDSDLVAVFQDPLFDKIHRDPRWLPFLRKLGKAPDQLAAINLKVIAEIGRFCVLSPGEAQRPCRCVLRTALGREVPAPSLGNGRS